MYSAFQPNAIQTNAAQVIGRIAVAQRTGGDGTGTLGLYSRRKTAEDVRQERIRLGIIPAPARKVVAKAARKAVQAVQQEQADPLEWLALHAQQQQEQLQRTLQARQIEFDLSYMLLLKLEIQRMVEQQREEEEVLTLLLDM